MNKTLSASLALLFVTVSADPALAARKKPKAAPPPPPGTTRINGVVYDSQGNAVSGGEAAAPSPAAPPSKLSPEQALRLKKLFLFPSIDDLNGALSPKLDEKLFELFSRNPRFELVRDPQVVKALSPDESSYYKAAQSFEVHREAARVTGADTTVLLRNHNVGANTVMVLELRDAEGGLLFSEQGSVPGSATWENRTALLEKLYGAILAKLPFEGAITGRTGNTLTVDLGFGHVHLGEEIEVARIVTIQRHPLLGTVVGTDFVRTGRAKITSVDRVLSFADVVEEAAGEKISPGQKVLLARRATVHRGAEATEERPARGKSVPRDYREVEVVNRGGEDEPSDDERLKGDFDQPKARFGLLGADLYYGSLAHNQSLNGTSSEYTGSGLGGDLYGELWVTRNWIFSAQYGFHNATLEGPGGSLGATSWSDFAAFGGYRVFPESLAEGVALTGSVGYQVMNFNVPDNAGLTVGGKKYSGLGLRADAEIAFLSRQTITGGVSILPFASLNETAVSLGSPGSATVIGVHLGWNHALAESFWLKVGMRYDVANGNYDHSSNTVTNKRFAIGPGIYYQF